MSKVTKSPKRKSKASGPARDVDLASRRKVVVGASLLGVLALTSALLLALEPNQLRPETTAPYPLAATIEPVLDTKGPISLGRWRYIYIHQSGNPQGSAASLTGPEGLGDHFVIGNGEGSGDGLLEIGDRWAKQLAAIPPTGANSIDANCISICLIGDFHQSLPTPAQMQKLQELVATLQVRYRIAAENVWMVAEQGGNRAVEIGRYFPVSAFRGQLVK